ncbi:MAG: hypothetical protein V1703_03285 [Candidatus Altiarchaeota archaeon]
MKKSFFTGVVLITLLVFFSANCSSEVIILNETKEQLYSVENVLVSGDLNANSLNLKGKGEVILGENVKVYLLGPSSDVLIRDVLVNGKATTVSFDKDGYFFLVPGTGKFDFTCAMDIRTIGQIQLYVRGPINELNFNLENGYAINGDEYGLYNKQVIIQRAEKAAMLVDGNFRYTYGERDEFLYQLNLQSFGSSLGRYVLDLKNNEIVSTVVGALKWEQSGNRLILDLEGNTASLEIRGLFNSNQLRIPLKEDRHHVLIESDPEKKITITTYAKEIDLSESPLGAQYSNARAFLASGDDVFQITVKKLELLPSLAATVDSAVNRIAITEKGSILGELTYRYKNTGMDYIEIDTPGTPLYASTGYSAVKLTKDNKLLLSFPKTSYGNLELLYFNTTDALGWISMIDVPLAKTELPISTATTTIYLPEDQFVVKTFGAKGGSELPTLTSTALFVIIFGILSAVLRKRAMFIAPYLVFTYVLMHFSLGLFLLWTAMTLALIVKKHTQGIPALKMIIAGAAAFLILAIILVVPLMLIWQMGVFNMGGAAPVEYEADYAMVQRAEAPVFKEMNAIGTGEGAITVPTRTGVLPVKMELPTLGKTITVKNDLVTKEKQVELKLLLVSTNFKYLAYLIALIALAVCKMEYMKEK